MTTSPPSSRQRHWKNLPQTRYRLENSARSPLSITPLQLAMAKTLEECCTRYHLVITTRPLFDHTQLATTKTLEESIDSIPSSRLYFIQIMRYIRLDTRLSPFFSTYTN
ncbi:hypothetical protein FPOAC2_07839 [Fusarium poae]